MAEDSTSRKKLTEQDIVSGIKKKTKELNEYLVDAKACPEISVSMKISGQQVKAVGIVNLLTIDLAKTTKL